MPEVNTGAVGNQLAKALDAQGKVAEAARAASQEAAAVKSAATPDSGFSWRDATPDQRRDAAEKLLTNDE